MTITASPAFSAIVIICEISGIKEIDFCRKSYSLNYSIALFGFKTIADLKASPKIMTHREILHIILIPMP
jgi:hypothetical protein